MSTIDPLAIVQKHVSFPERKTYHKILQLLPPPTPQLRVLDCPAGAGYLTHKLIAAGYTVEAGDLYPEIFTVANFTATRCNLNQKIPWRENYFDAAVFCGGTEVLDNLPNAISELSRVIKPGGTLIVVMPNTQNLRSRLFFLATGFLNKFNYPLDEVHGMDGLRPVMFWEIRYFLHTQGLRISKIAISRIKWQDWLMLPLIPAVFILTVLIGSIRMLKIRDPLYRKVTWDVYKQMLTSQILLGKSLILQTRKCSPIGA